MMSVKQQLCHRALQYCPAVNETNLCRHLRAFGVHHRRVFTRERSEEGCAGPHKVLLLRQGHAVGRLGQVCQAGGHTSLCALNVM